MPTDTKRTKMIHIYTPADAPFRVEIERETLRTFENAESLPIPAGDRRVRVALADIENDQVPGGPVVITTYSDLRALLSTCATSLATADEEAEAARLAALNPDEP